MLVSSQVENNKVAIIEGVRQLEGCEVKATDLRAGAALIIAGLLANGATTLENILFIDRGYEDVVAKFGALGADIRRVTVQEAAAADNAG